MDGANDLITALVVEGNEGVINENSGYSTQVEIKRRKGGEAEPLTDYNNDRQTHRHTDTHTDTHTATHTHRLTITDRQAGTQTD